MSPRFFSRTLLAGLAALAACSLPSLAPAAVPSPDEVRKIAREAYVYGFPLVDNLRIQHAYFVDKGNPEFKAPYNELFNIPRVFTPEDRAVQTPNSDTPYSWIGFDLRAEPMVITIPSIQKDRYWSVQLIDLYTHNFAYLGTRTTGNDGGSFMLVGPKWKGAVPKGITRVIRCETEIALGLFRTQLFNPGDLANVRKIQDQYGAKPLSAFLGQRPPKAAPVIAFPLPLTPAEQKTSLDFFARLNFALRFAPTHPSEKGLMERFGRIGIAAGKPFDAARLSPATRKAMEEGMAAAWQDFGGLVEQVNAGKVSSGDILGTREHLKNNYLYRMGGAVLGIYGNSKEEAMYPAYFVDADGQKLDGSRRYTLRFAPGQLPPVGAFWSLTMYEQPASLLVANPLDRYLLNSTMLPQFKRDADGGLTLLVQTASPGRELEGNWLPAPKGPFSLIMRLYLPQAAALDGKWKAPPLQRAD